MKKVFSKLACVRGGFIREGQRRGGQAVGSSTLSRGFAARSPLSSAQLTTQGFFNSFLLFFFQEMNRAQIQTILNVLQKTVKIVKILSVSI